MFQGAVSMEINNVVALMSSISTIVSEIKTLSKPLLVRFFWISNESNLRALQDKVSLLETQINLGFPQLEQLIRIYSSLLVDVKIAYALSDKLAEMYDLVPGLAKYRIKDISDTQERYTRISRDVNNLPYLNVSEQGKLESKLDQIRDIIHNLKTLDSTNPDPAKLKEMFGNISNQYSDIETTLSALLNEILASLKPQV